MCLPGSRLVAACGGAHVSVFDLMGGGRRVARLSHHQKTVTCLAAADRTGAAGARGPRLLSGSLDGAVKVYETGGFSVVHSFGHEAGAAVTALGVSPCGGALAVGLADGRLLTRRHAWRGAGEAAAGGDDGGVGGVDDADERGLSAAELQGGARRGRTWLTAGNYAYFTRGQSDRADATDVVVERQRRAGLAPYDRLLRRFRHAEALDAALGSGSAAAADAVAGALEARGALAEAVGGRDAAGLCPLLRHLCRHLPDPRYSRTLLRVTELVIDAYAPVVGAGEGRGDAEVDSLFGRLGAAVAAELRAQERLMELDGALEEVLGGGMAG